MEGSYSGLRCLRHSHSRPPDSTKPQMRMAQAAQARIRTLHEGLPKEPLTATTGKMALRGSRSPIQVRSPRQPSRAAQAHVDAQTNDASTGSGQPAQLSPRMSRECDG